MRGQLGWPEPYTHTVYDRMYGDFPAKNFVIHRNTYKCMVLANPSEQVRYILACGQVSED